MLYIYILLYNSYIYINVGTPIINLLNFDLFGYGVSIYADGDGGSGSIGCTSWKFKSPTNCEALEA